MSFLATYEPGHGLGRTCCSAGAVLERVLEPFALRRPGTSPEAPGDLSVFLRDGQATEVGLVSERTATNDELVVKSVAGPTLAVTIPLAGAAELPITRSWGVPRFYSFDARRVSCVRHFE